MASAQVQKFSTNTWTKKTTRKKWPVIDNQPKAKRDIVIIHKKAEHTYENVEYKRTIPLATSTPKKLPTIPLSSLEPRKETKIPKLVKSKTCSIIESKCILKKSVSQPLNDSSIKNKLPDKKDIKTKSLNNLDTTSNLKKITAPKILELKSNFIQSVTKTKNDNGTLNKQTQNQTNNVKEIVRRLNSLTELNQSCDSDVKPPMSKAKSTLDLSSNKKLSYSKIPVNTLLRKTYPSIPCDLNHLDSDKCSGGIVKHSSLNGKLAKSAYNLASTSQPKLSLPNMDKNTRNYSKLSSNKVDQNNLGKSIQNLSLASNRQKPIHKSVQNLTRLSQFDNKSKPITQRRDFVNQDIKSSSTGLKVVKNMTQTFNGVQQKTETTKHAPKSQEELRKLSTKPFVTRTTSSNFKIKTKNDLPKPVIQIAEDFNKPCGKPKLLKSEPIKLGSKKEKEIKVSKSTHPTIIENKFSVKAKDEPKNGEDYHKIDVKLNLKTVHKLNMNLEQSLKKDYDYNSDNSDDSGNISNEMEIDSEEIGATPSRESLSAVLNGSVPGQDSGVDLLQIQRSQLDERKVRTTFLKYTVCFMTIDLLCRILQYE